MEQTLDKVFFPGLRGLWQLSRPIPFLAWSGCAILLGAAPALADQAADKIPTLLVILLTAWLLQGLLSHAANDRQDWLSGTDAASPGILSGGSGVVKAGLLTLKTLGIVEKAAFLTAAAVTLYFVKLRGPEVLLLLMIGTWSSLAYSRNPLRLAYRPLLGEWLCAFPAVVTVTIGTYFLLTGALNTIVFSLGILHGLFSVGWLMIHHLADIPADLSANPQKKTTPAWLYATWGPPAAKDAAVLYFILAVSFAVVSAIYLSKLFLLSIPFGLLSIVLICTIDLKSVKGITVLELSLITLVFMQTILLGGTYL